MLQPTPVTAASTSWLVNDDQVPAAGQRRRSELLATARRGVEGAVDAVVAPVGFHATGCPYLTTLFGRLDLLPVGEVERALRGLSGGAADVDGALAAVFERAAGAASAWVGAGQPLEANDVVAVVAPYFPELAAAASVPVQRMAAPGAAAPAHVGRPMGGQPADPAVRAPVEAAVGMSLGHARVSVDGAAAAAAGARGYTVGGQIVLDPAAYRPGTVAGDLLLAHELAHVAQQSRGGGSAPGAAHEEEADAVAAAILTGQRRSVFGAPLALQRCDRDSPTSTTTPPVTRTDELKALIQGTDTIIAKGTKASFGDLAAAHSEHQLYKHELAVLETGTGIYTGNQSAEAKANTQPAGVTKSDCTELVYEILGKAFASAGQDAMWTAVKKQARANTKARGQTAMIGVDLQAALQSEAGWSGIFWAPDPKFAYKKSDGVTDDTEHGYAYDVARSAAGPKDKRGYYYKATDQPGVRVDKLAVKFAPEAGSTTKADPAALAGLKALPFGVLAARGGQHMAIIAHGKVIEIHWKQESTSVTTIEATPIESWAWKSGVIVAPAADVTKAFP